MIRKFLTALALSALSLSASAATYSFSYQGLGAFKDTKGHGTFTVQAANLGILQPVLSASGTFNDPTDTTYQLLDRPATGLAAVGADFDNPFTSDNMLGKSAGGYSLSAAGIVLAGVRLPADANFPAMRAYVHLFACTTSVGHYCAETYLLPFAGYAGIMHPAPVVFSVQLVSAGTGAPTVSPVMPRPGPIPAPMPSN